MTDDKYHGIQNVVRLLYVVARSSVEVIAMGAISFMFIGLAYNLLDSQLFGPRRAESEGTLLREKVIVLEGEVFTQGKELASLKSLVSSLSNNPQVQVSAAVTTIKETVGTFDGRVDRLEQALMTSPEKSLALPLLRQELDRSTEQHLRDIESVRSDVGRVYDINKWVFGLIAASLLGLTLNTMLTKRPKPPSEQTKA
jgi:hypothetical protein